jgi:pilus assembly protein CpaE
MQTLIISDDEALGSRIRLTLLGMGHECPPSNLVRPDRALDALASAKPQLGVLAVGSELGEAISTIGHVKRAAGCPMLVVGSLANPKSVLQVLRSGADDYVDQVDLEDELPGVADGLIAGTRGGTQLGHIVAVLGPSGGSGATTVAVNMAVTLAKQHKSACFVDLKLATGDAASLLDIRPIHSLVDLLQNVDRIDRSIFERTLSRHDCGVALLASPRRYDVREMVSPAGTARILELARSVSPFVVLDIDSALGPEQMQALQVSDAIVIVMRLEFNSLCNVRQAIDYLTRHNINRERLMVVANRQGQPKEIPIAKVEEALGQKVSLFIPDDPKTVIRANNNGIPVVNDSPSARCSKNLVQLATLVGEKLSKEE